MRHAAAPAPDAAERTTAGTSPLLPAGPGVPWAHSVDYGIPGNVIDSVFS